ncbi:DNA polymerase III subunit alpha [Thalassiella azotivora]
MSFTHLHVASGYSLRHGASSPATLVGRAAELGLPALALTDRDGLYGSVKHVTACASAGLAPLLGVDLAVEPSGLLPAPAGRRTARRTPARGGAEVDRRLPRVTVLARAGGVEGLPAAAGWGRLCRLVSATHLRGERGRPVTTTALVGEHATDPTTGSPALTVLLGPDSEIGRAVLARRADLARALLARWYDAVPLGALAVEVVCHLGPQGTPASLAHAAGMLALAREAGLPAVLTNAVRYATPDGAPTADVLDAARRLVPLSARSTDRTTARAHLAGADEMSAVARRVAEAAGDAGAAATLLRETERVAGRSHLDPAADLGIGRVHLPEPQVVVPGFDPARDDANQVLRERCLAGIGRRYPGLSGAREAQVATRLDDELATVAALGYPTYFLTVAEVCDLIRSMDVRVAARGSGAGSLVNYLLGVSGVDPLAHGLLMERFCTPLRAELPDIDVDVESARRTEVYERVLERFGGERVGCVSMMDTYRVRHAVRDVGAALGMPPGEVDAIAKSFPHIRARDVRHAVAELPELRASGLGQARLDLLFDLVERLDGLPRHVALHPCGVLLSDATLGDRTPVEASWLGFPMSQLDKDDVEVMGLLKLDVLGIRMQSAMAYAVQEVRRVDGTGAVGAGGHHPDAPYLDAATGTIDLDAVPLDDEATFRLVRSTRTLGCFQIESPGQRELVGKFAPQTFADLITDISLFRPGPVKSDMVTPFLRARQGWDPPDYLHPLLREPLEQTYGVVVFHEQVIDIVAITAGVSRAEADEVRRALGSRDGQAEVEAWWRPRALERGFDEADADRVWEVLKAFASFGFCKAHAAAFALPTYQSAWLKAHHPAAFLAGVLTHDPGMYPKRLILDDARNLGIAVLGLDVNASGDTYRVEKVAPWDEPPPAVLDQVDAGPLRPDAGPRRPPEQPDDLPAAGTTSDGAPLRLDAAVPDARGYGIRLSLSDVKGISEAEVARVVAGQPYHSLADFWHRARVSRPVAERLVLAGGFDSLYGLGSTVPVRRRGQVTRRDLLLQLAELDRWTRSQERSARAVSARRGRTAPPGSTAPTTGGAGPSGGAGGAGSPVERHLDVRTAAARQSQAARPVQAAQDQPVQMALDLGDRPDETVPSGLPEMTSSERVRAELEVLGLDASRHVVDFYAPLLGALGVTRSPDLVRRRSRSELLVAGVKVATQTPPIRSGRRVVFLTLDDSHGPVDATFFEDVQGPYAATVFGSWLLLVRGELRRTGPRGVSLRATGAWSLPELWDAWTDGGLPAVHAVLTDTTGYDERAVQGGAASRSSRPVMARPPLGESRDDGDLVRFGGALPDPDRQAAVLRRSAAAAAAAPAAATVKYGGTNPPSHPTAEPDPTRQGTGAAGDGAAGGQEEHSAGGMGGGTRHRRVLVHASGFRQSPYADVKPSGDDVRDTRGAAGRTEQDAERRRRSEAPRKLWHSSPGSSGR